MAARLRLFTDRGGTAAYSAVHDNIAGDLLDVQSRFVLAARP
jgi:hypothetical protein